MTNPYSQLSAKDFVDATLALLPPGAAWTREPSSVLVKFFSAIAHVAFYLHKYATNLFDIELDPSQAIEMLPDWQRVFGVSAAGTIDDQHTHLVAVIGDPGGFTSAHYIALAASIGVTITTSVASAFVWSVHASASLGATKRAQLEALITAHNRATCVLNFVYS